MSTAEEIVLASARMLFAERGYAATTIKDIATAAGYSPALVMKIGGSKAGLYAATKPSAPPLTDDNSATVGARVGYELVGALVARRDRRDNEPWAMIAVHVHEAPNPQQVRAEIRERYVGKIAERIGDTEPGRVRSQLVVSLLLGLATGLRTVELLETDSVSAAELTQRYGALVQAAIDG
ncbi:hypothetical protein ABH922_002425 [Rhodococcus sp. 27YEA15]|uniref:TetR/AcrR family transcriptional regulator n=1 Tax=Rhodococcus sp. 27YEA15 TaxID=3156259 RepID=UPI003C7ED191